MFSVDLLYSLEYTAYKAEFGDLKVTRSPLKIHSIRHKASAQNKETVMYQVLQRHEIEQIQ